MEIEHRASTQFRKKTDFAMKSQSSIAGWIFGKLTMQRKRMKTMEFNIATRKVRSMLQAGKMEEIADELKQYNIQGCSEKFSA